MRDLFQRIMASVQIDPEKGCWIWRGRLDRKGYGWLGEKLVHRLTYTLLVGEIPSGLCLDHIICDRPACCRPDHLRPSTTWENTRRGMAPSAVNARKTECIRGHVFNEPNTYRHNGHRHCRACNRAAVARYKARQKARAA